MQSFLISPGNDVGWLSDRTNNPDRRIGIAIRDARRAAGMSQDALARELGIDRVTISRYESGARPASPLAITHIATCLGVAVTTLAPEYADTVTYTDADTSPETLADLLYQRPDLTANVLDMLGRMRDEPGRRL